MEKTAEVRKFVKFTMAHSLWKINTQIIRHQVILASNLDNRPSTASTSPQILIYKQSSSAISNVLPSSMIWGHIGLFKLLVVEHTVHHKGAQHLQFPRHRRVGSEISYNSKVASIIKFIWILLSSSVNVGGLNFSR